MKKYSLIFIFLFTLNYSVTSSQTSVNETFTKYSIYDTDGIKPQEYQQRRATVIALMDSGSVAIFRANGPDNRNGDTDYRFRQNDNFLYLTGCNETNSTLILFSNGMQIDSIAKVNEILFINEYTKSWSGYNLGVEGAKKVLGFGAEVTKSVVLTSEKLKELLPKILKSKKKSLLHTVITRYPYSSNCDKKYWGIGIRIEDDILVTENGCKVLSEGAPRNVEEI